MNKQKWLIVGLSLAMAATLGVGISACGEKEPDTPPTPTEHTHNYDAWDYDETQHWKYCDEHGTDKSNIDETTRANHTFKDGKCECGATEGTGPVTPAELDTREFYVVGGGMGTLKSGTWNGARKGFDFTKAEQVDEDGYTVYTFTMELYSADEFKFIEKNAITETRDEATGQPIYTWNDELVFTYFDLDLSAVEGKFKEVGGNIVVETGADGKYEFTIRTKNGGVMKENQIGVKLLEPLEPLSITDQYEMYLVGKIAAKPTTKWPSEFGKLDDVTTNCYKLELQEDGQTFGLDVHLVTSDTFKVWNYKTHSKDAGYYPTGMGGDLTVKANGWYFVSWKVGDTTVEVGPHTHRYTEWGKDATQHWKVCPLDGAIDENSKTAHTYDAETGLCECGAITSSSCAHDAGVDFDYTAETVPTPVAEGGTVKGKCKSCGEEIDAITYDKGVEYSLWKNEAGRHAPVAIEDDKTYYGVVKNGAWDNLNGAAMGYAIHAAGTLKVTLTALVYGKGNTNAFNTKSYPIGLHEFYVSQSSLEDGEIESNSYNKGIMRAGTFISNAQPAQKAWMQKLVTDEPIGQSRVEFHSMEVTFEEGDVGQYLYFLISCYDGSALCFDVTFTPAETIIAPAEVAILPEKKD